MTGVSARHWVVVREVIASTSDGASLMSAVPGMVRRLLDEEAWRSFEAPGVGAVEHGTFREFVSAPPPRGLGGHMSQLLALCGSDEDLRGRVRLLGLSEVPAARSHGGDRRSESKQDYTLSLKPNRAEHVVARLKRESPEMADRVISGEVSVHAAARQMGWRRPTITVSSPEKVAEALRRAMSPEDLARLMSILGSAE